MTPRQGVIRLCLRRYERGILLAQIHDARRAEDPELNRPLDRLAFFSRLQRFDDFGHGPLSYNKATIQMDLS